MAGIMDGQQGMTNAQRTTPSWGAFKGIKPQSAKPSPIPDAPAATPTIDPDNSFLSTRPAFDIHAEPLGKDESFYATPSHHRNEEEFDELGEGAIRQIGRSFISLVSMGSAAALMAAAVFWAMPSGDQAQMAEAESKPNVILEGEGVAVASGHEFFIGDVSDLRGRENKVFSEAIQIDVDLPIPSVIAKAEENTTPVQSALSDDLGYPGPTPLPRSVAFAALENFEDSPMAQGSDDEALSAARSAVASTEQAWVSVMIPKDRPHF